MHCHHAYDLFDWGEEVLLTYNSSGITTLLPLHDDISHQILNDQSVEDNALGSLHSYTTKLWTNTTPINKITCRTNETMD